MKLIDFQYQLLIYCHFYIYAGYVSGLVQRSIGAYCLWYILSIQQLFHRFGNTSFFPNQKDLTVELHICNGYVFYIRIFHFDIGYQ